MCRDEFIRFMKDQLNAINRYKDRLQRVNKGFDSNSCVFEWIDNNAKKFSERWQKSRKN